MARGVISLDRAENMSREELMQVNGAIDQADEELMAIINQGVYGTRKK